MKANAVLLHSCEVTAVRQAAIVRLYVSALRLTLREMSSFQFEQIGVIRSPYKENSPFRASQVW